MARDEFKDYEELLKVFEDDSTAKKPKEDAGNVSLNSQVEHSQSERQKKIDNFKVNINSDSTEKPARNPGVYFSNPPKDIKRDAQKNKEMPAHQGNNADRFRVSAPPITQRQNDLKAAKEARDKKRSETFFGRLLASENFSKLALMLAIIIFSSVLICIYGINCINDVLAINTDDVAIEVTISEKMSDSEVINTLKEKDLIHNSLFCKFFVKLLDKGGNYVSGVYTLNPNMGIENMLATMQADVTLSETVKLTFPEGWTVDQIAEKLEANKVCTASSFLSTLEMVDFSEDFDFVAAIDNKELRFRMLEGYMYPDTYEFYVGENAASVVRRFLNNFQNRWTTEYQTQADDLGVSIDEAIVMASILQAEAATSSQMPEISSVLYNRLAKPSVFPKIECDSTEKYLLETIKPTLTSTTEDIQKYISYRDNYDTYSDACIGLPVGAIGNPGDAAIRAALFPADTNYYYFRHDDDGKIYYANSLSEHEENGRKIARSSAD